MADNIPAKLKPAQIAAFAKRANQLDKFKPIVSYWLRFYIVQKIIAANLHTADAECTAYTTSLMETLEQTKAENPAEDALLDEVAAAAYCEQFALQTFAKGERDMNANTVTKNTADTLLAASTFLEMLAIWKKDTEPEIKSKQTFAKYHAVRILKAFQAGEDPNLTNPVHEPPPQAASPSNLDPNDPEVRNINNQPYVETAPNTSGHPSPVVSTPNMSPPPPQFPSAPSGYRDVSPISQPDTGRKGSVGSVGGGYFPRVDVPTFTADTAPPGLPTAPSIHDEPMTSPLDGSSLPTDSSVPQAPQAPDAGSFYQNVPSSHPTQSLLQQSSLPQEPFQAPQPSSPPPQFQPPSQQQYNYPQQSQQPKEPQQPPLLQQHDQVTTPRAPEALIQGPFKTDEDSQAAATKHAKFAISALNFEDVNTAVNQLRLALRALGAN